MPPSPIIPSRFRLWRACLKGGLLYGVFLLVYALTQPVLNGHLPTLYNVLGPGRLRLNVDLEPNIHLLLNDHAIQRASPDTWNVVMLGSSEVYGLYDIPQKAMPMSLDEWGLQTANGQRVRFYNLSYPIPDVAKDLLIIDTLLKAKLPINLVILNVNAWSFTPLSSHGLLAVNPEATQDLIARYQLSPASFADIPPSHEHSLGADRSTLNAWLMGQMDLARWSLWRIDNRGNGPQIHLNIDTGANVMLPITRAEGLRAFRQLSDMYQVPVLLINVPRTFSQDDFLPWLYVESANAHLPLLDCEFIFGETDLFIDSVHLKPTTDPLYARILAHHFSRAEMGLVARGMPLRLPADISVDETQPECVFLPVAKA